VPGDGTGVGNCPRFPQLSTGEHRAKSVEIMHAGGIMSGSKWDAPAVRAALIGEALEAMHDQKPFPKSDYLALKYSRHLSQMARHVKWLEDRGSLKFRAKGKQRYVVMVSA
jgi:hypothetical protein